MVASMKTLWSANSEEAVFMPLAENISADVVIIGGGITGMMTAHLLVKSGIRPIVLEALEIGEGTTACSTGNLYAVIDKRLHQVQSKFDTDTLKAVVESRTAAINMIESVIHEYLIDCNFSRMPWYLYNEHDPDDKLIEQEKKAAMTAGLDVFVEEQLPLPYQVKKAIRIENQAQFNPAAFVKELAKINEMEGVRIFTNTPVLEIEGAVSPFVLKTPKGSVTAQKVIHATHTPKGIFPVHTALGPYREYAIAGKLRSGNYPEGIFWSTEQEHHISVRSYFRNEEKYILIIGLDHKVGQADDHFAYYRKLENYARSKFDFESIDYRWSAQHYKPADGLAYIGETLQNNVYIATGFSTDGLTYGSLSAMILSDILNGRQNPWAEMYNPKRFTPVASAGKVIKENINVLTELIKDFLGKSEDFPVITGEGKILEREGKKWAVSRDEQGQLHVVSALCPHMKCVVHWNNAEKTWDCPCHGSRFKATGEVIEGPAYHPLNKMDSDKLE
jgi:glycine/D-amino acid oxidase-like deaminating enzyme/nitrite reductase/ring-hydroxylating ferredoxin subunit